MTKQEIIDAIINEVKYDKQAIARIMRDDLDIISLMDDLIHNDFRICVRWSKETMTSPRMWEFLELLEGNSFRVYTFEDKEKQDYIIAIGKLNA